jgi:pimeloyl-ACP methyl ester carboxylesterase
LPAFRKPVPDGVREAFATVAGHRMRYLTAGSGPPLLLIHGLMGYSFSFTENISELAKNSTVFAPDMFNLGWSERVKIPCSLDAAASQMFGFMDAVGVPATDILGSSHGGSVAIKMSFMKPERVRSLIMVSPAHPYANRLKYLTSLIAVKGIGESLGWIIRHTPRLLWRLMLYRIYSRASRALPGTIEGYGEPIVAEGTTQHALRLVRCWQKDFDELRRELDTRQSTIPVLFIWGDRDKVVPHRTAAELVKRFPGAELITIPDSGHVPYEELPEQFNAAVTQFLNKVRG